MGMVTADTAICRVAGAIAVVLAGLCMLLWASVAGAVESPGRIDGTCFRALAPTDTVSAAIDPAAEWRCGPDLPTVEPERTVLRFAIADGEAPQVFVMRRAEFGGLTLLVESADGSIARRTVTLDDFTLAGIDGYVATALPESATPRRAYAIIDRPVSSAQLTGTHLASAHPATMPGFARGLLMVALICGMLLMPFVFDVAFWRVLREPFLVWHTICAAAMLACVALTSGLAGFAFGLSTGVNSTLTTLSFGLTVAGGTMFGHAFIEPDKLDPRIRRLMPFTAGLAVVLSVLHAAFPFALRPVHLDLYMIAFIPVIAVLLLAMGDALRRGSRAAWFQAIGWGPLLLTGLIRQVTFLGPAQGQDAMTLFYAGCAFEVIATAVGIADRLLLLRRQRDDAVDEAREMQRLSSHDPLTGLLNRRAVEPRFRKLREEGFDTLALMDLDRFKDINDRFGHQVGDEVLVACGEVLRNPADRDSIAMRLGGEEFMVLLRGAATTERVERLREAIPLAVATRVADLDRIVTASMGVVEIPRRGLSETSFGELYARADALLYEAKVTGRNRTVSERLIQFPGRRKRRESVA